MPAHTLRAIVFGAVVLLLLYRRIRRNIGRQRLRPIPMTLRIALLSGICVLLASHGLSVEAMGAAAGGGFTGVILGLAAARFTIFEVTPQGHFYTPNRYAGLAVSALFIGRILYRLMTGAARLDPSGQIDVLGSIRGNRLTLGLYFLLAGYYVVYYASLLLRSRRETAAVDAGEPSIG